MEKYPKTTYICDHCKEERPFEGPLHLLPEHCAHCTTLHFFENKPEPLLLCQAPRCKWSIQAIRRKEAEQKAEQQAKRKAARESKKRKREESASKCFYCADSDTGFHPWGPKNNPYSLCTECWDNMPDRHWILKEIERDAKEHYPKLVEKLVEALQH